MKILQLGKFYPIRGGVEKVMWDITNGISARGIDCDMLCAKLGKRRGYPVEPPRPGHLRTDPQESGRDHARPRHDPLVAETRGGI